MRRLRIAGLVVCLLLLGCTDPQEYQQEKPAFDPQVFYNGTLDSWGVVRDWKGQATQRFHMVMTASWQGDIGTFDEDFTYADGTKRARHWTIKKIDARHFEGTAPDVTGKAIGEVYGNALHWTYTIQIPEPGVVKEVDFDDWLFMIEDDTAFSLVKIHKFGLPVGELTMFFRKRAA